MRTTNYQNTLVLPSPDCRAACATQPANPDTVAAMHFARLVASPYHYTSDDLQFEVYADRRGIAPEEQGPARMEFFAKSQACLRSSPLVKNLGWALHHDGEGRVALVDPDSDVFQTLMSENTITKRFGLRSKRARGE